MHRYLYLVNYGKSFDTLCSINPDFIQLFGASAGQLLSPSYSQSRTSEFIFTADDGRHIDLSTIVASGNHLFRFQSVYSISKGEAPVVFDTGASISITPYREDFIDFDENLGHTKL